MNFSFLEIARQGQACIDLQNYQERHFDLAQSARRLTIRCILQAPNRRAGTSPCNYGSAMAGS
jgi:hypothetical protein